MADVTGSEALRPKGTFFCPHCEQCLSKKTFKRHKYLYFDIATNEWTKEAAVVSEDDEPFDTVDLLSDIESELREKPNEELEPIEPPIVDFDSDMDFDITEEDSLYHGK